MNFYEGWWKTYHPHQTYTLRKKPSPYRVNLAANEIFGEEESDQENDFEGLTAEGFAEARAGLFRNQVEDDDDISVDEYSSESEVVSLT